MSANEDNIEEPPEVKRQRLSSPCPEAASSSWIPSVSGEVESCDSGLSDSGVTTPPVTDETQEPTPGHSGAHHGDIDNGGAADQEQDDDDDSLSGLSDMSGHEWKPDMSNKLSWLHAAMRRGEDPREILVGLIPNGSEIPQSLDNMTIWKILFNLLSEPPRRSKLDNVNTLEDCVELIKNSRNIIVLTGAGVSVSCGIPDFRSRDGVYARLAVDFPDLPDPQAMFDIHYFKKDPRPFFKFAREIYPGQFKPSPCHQFIRCIESCGKLLRNYTQNIDTLEQVAGIHNVIQCHGSFATASCMVCHRKVDAEVIREDIFKQTIPKCGQCPEPDNDNDAGGDQVSSGAPSISDILSPAPVQMPVMKPDIVFFGEGLPDHFHTNIARDKSECDLLIVIGSSLKVRPVALIPSSLPPEVPQILINREPLPHLSFDVELLGDCDTIVNQICLMLGGEEWREPIGGESLTQHTGLPQSLASEKQSKDYSEDKVDKDEPIDKDKAKEVEDESSTEHEDMASATSELIRTVDANQAPENVMSNADSEDDEGGDDWKMKSLSDYIPSGQFLFLPPSRYVFPGAEVYPDSSDDEDDDEDDLEDEQNEGDKVLEVDNREGTSNGTNEPEELPEEHNGDQNT